MYRQEMRRGSRRRLAGWVALATLLLPLLVLVSAAAAAPAPPEGAWARPARTWW